MNGSRLHSYWRLSMLSTGTALLFALLLLLGYHGYSKREDLLQGLTMQARLLGANLTAAIVFEDGRTAGEIIGTAESSPIIIEAGIYRLDGSLMARFERPGSTPVLGNVAPPAGHAFSLTDLQLSLPVRLENRDVGLISLRASLDHLYVELLRVFGSMVLILIVSATLGNAVSRRMRLQMAAAESEIERMALYDRVTGLANRHAFELGLAQALQRHSREGGGSALLFIDVDGFKKVNDRFGHQTGDTVLKAIGERLGKSLRASDIVARIGGDEFAVILTNTQSVDAAALVAENLVRSAAEPFATGSTPAHVGFSIGICMIPDDGADVESALRNADLAMYHAKQAGKNTHRFFSEHLGAKTQRGLDIEAGLRRALAQRDLKVAYQAQRSTRSGRIEGIEALVRWHHPQHGPISPMEFIPVAEEAGLIRNIGDLVLEQVCSDIAGMKAAGLAVPSVAINVSARQVGAARAGGRHPRRAGAPRTDAAGDQDRADRERVHRPGRYAHRDARRYRRAGHRNRDRRFRHRLFVAGLPARPADIDPEDRHALHPRPAGKRRSHGAGPGHHRHGPRHRPAGHRGRRRVGDTGGMPGASGLRPAAGLSHRVADGTAGTHGTAGRAGTGASIRECP
jgi:diguanylate cyclase (GGDEF)-like protein